MSAFDTSPVVIGSKTRSGAGGPRETTVKSKSALNAAARSGAILSTEKKFASANAADSGSEGQRLTKVDRSDEIIKPKTVSKRQGDAIAAGRLQMVPKLDRKQLALRVGMTENELGLFETGKAPFNPAKLKKIENTLKIKLLGNEKEIGEPKVLGPKKDAAKK